MEEQQKIIQRAEENSASAFSISKEDIESVLLRGSLFVEGKYRIFRQFRKHEDKKENIKFLKHEYGIGGGNFTFPDGFLGSTSHDSKGIAINRSGSFKNEGILFKWTEVEKRLRELIANGRYLTADEMKHYAGYLESISAPAHEIDMVKRVARYHFINAHRDLPPSEKRDSLALRLSDFIRDLPAYEKNLLGNVERPDLSDVCPQELDQSLNEPATVQQLIDFLSLAKGKTSDVFIRNNTWQFEQELFELHPMRYLYQEGDVVIVGTGRYRVGAIEENTITLQNADFPLLTESFDRADLEEKLQESQSNDRYKKVVTDDRMVEVSLKSPVSSDGLLDQLDETSELIGREIILDDRRFVIESIGSISGDVSLRDATFQEGVGFPINRVEKIDYVRGLLETEQRESPSEEKTITSERRNFRITDEDLGTGSPKQRYRSNITAIKLLKTLEDENRLAAPDEQETLSNYVGWGGLSMAFDENNASWRNEYAELKELLDTNEYEAAMESTLSAFYTPPAVIDAMYNILERMNFTDGKVLEPACGTGHFFGMLPESMEKAELHGIEIDSVSGRIAKQLYPNAEISVRGFEETNYPDNHFDVVIGNVPFGDFKMDDENYNKNHFLIHDYFFAKALDQVRPGGVVLFITSKGTMDKKNPEVRKYIAQRAELLGAIRLPDNTFKAAAGTEVTSDIIILKKRERIIQIEPDWVHLDQNQQHISMNSYFVSHPEMIMGEMVLTTGRFGVETACKEVEGTSLEKSLANAVRLIDGEISTDRIDAIDDVEDVAPMTIPADPSVRNFSYVLIDEKIYFKDGDQMSTVKVSATAEKRIRGLIELRDCVRKLIALQTEDVPDAAIEEEQKVLNKLYSTFVVRHGLINSRGNAMAFSSDESYFLLCSLEILDEDGNFKCKADMFSKRTIKPRRVITSAENAVDALAISLGEKARVDLAYMTKITEKSEEELVADLHGVIFKEPGSEPAHYATADEYLSGNVREKLKEARQAAEIDPQFSVNVEALEQVIPKDLGPGEIAVRLGATWIPPEDVQAFIMEHLTPGYYARERILVRYAAVTSEWFIENKRLDQGNVKAMSTYGTKRMSAYKLIEDTLNLKDVRVFDYVVDVEGKKKAVLNHKETTAAQAKQGMIKQAFQDWIWKEPDRRSRLLRVYNDRFNSVRPREYDGSHITFAGMNPEIKLRPHQVNAVAHHLYGGNTLLAHKVGAGKSATRS